jgi:hypothetical protein
MHTLPARKTVACPPVETEPPEAPELGDAAPKLRRIVPVKSAATTKPTYSGGWSGEAIGHGGAKTIYAGTSVLNNPEEQASTCRWSRVGRRRRPPAQQHQRVRVARGTSGLCASNALQPPRDQPPRPSSLTTTTPRCGLRTEPLGDGQVSPRGRKRHRAHRPSRSGRALAHMRYRGVAA